MKPLLTLIVLCLCAAALRGEDSGYQPPVAQASNEGQLALQRFRVPEGMRVELFAAEPLLANPVAFCLDEQGRVYVAETFRQQKGVEDNRFHGNWLETDLSLQTVEDRAAMFRKFLPDQGASYTQHHDRIRRLLDRDGDGKADASTVFADGFNDLLDGTGAGLLARHGQLWYTCIPKLWLLEDQDDDGKAEQKVALHHGYGVRVAFRGHDMHGLIMGPDGKLYYSIGDRGYNVVTPEGRRLARPATGAVFRCNPDGSELEEFAYGLRNPQELAFDDFGNLFTGDNNSDGGDKARWVHVTEGSDTGWRMYYQYLPDRGPWNREQLWHPAHAGQAAYIVPPIVNLGDGPSGLVYYPGVGLPERYQGHFFLCDFRGTPGQSGVRSFALKPSGATFELVDQHEFIWQTLATDIDFGYDGKIYLSDWVDGWEGLGKGRIYTFSDPTQAAAVRQANSAELMKNGLHKLSENELGDLLRHPDRRIRQEAQFTLADRGATAPLTTAAIQNQHQLARLHGIWGLGQIARRQPELLERVATLLTDADPEVRAQACRVLGDARYRECFREVAALTRDPEPRVKLFAAMALGKIGNPDGLKYLLMMLVDDRDPEATLRHGIVMGLTWLNQPEAMLKQWDHPVDAVRLAILLALRRLGSPEVARFLEDENELIVLEAARAIHDEPIPAAFPALAALASQPTVSDPLLRRVLNANFRLGQPEHASAVVQLAANERLPEAVRLEAVAELRQWSAPPKLDRVLGDYRPLPARDSAGIPDALRTSLSGLFQGSEKLRTESAKLMAQYGIKEVGPVLLRLFESLDQPAETRVAALEALDTLQDAKIREAVQLAVTDAVPEVRASARNILARRDPQAAIPALAEALRSGTLLEQQQAIASLAGIKRPEAETILLQSLEQLAAGKTPAGIQLDLLEMAKTRQGRFAELLRDYEKSRPADDPLAEYRECLEGGSAKRGEEIFFGRTAVSCRRCHKVGSNGGEVGPNLSDIGLKQKRPYLLEALILPDKTIAKGFDTVVLALVDGRIITGIVRQDTQTTLTVIQPDGQSVTVKKEDIDDQAKGRSAMPDDLKKNVTKSDIRDLVEYLSTLKQTPDGLKHE